MSHYANFIEAQKEVIRSYLLKALSVIPNEYRDAFHKYTDVLGDLFHIGINAPNEYGYFHRKIREHLFDNDYIGEPYDLMTKELDFLDGFESWTEYFLRPCNNIHKIAKDLKYDNEFNDYLETTKNILKEHLGHDSCECQSFGYIHDQVVKRLQLEQSTQLFIDGIRGQMEISIRNILKHHKEEHQSE